MVVLVVFQERWDDCVSCRPPYFCTLAVHAHNLWRMSKYADYGSCSITMSHLDLLSAPC